MGEERRIGKTIGEEVIWIQWGKETSGIRCLKHQFSTTGGYISEDAISTCLYVSTQESGGLA